MLHLRGGADIVLDRIENTAESICGDRPGPMQLQERAGVANCTYETTEIAVNDSGIPMLHQRYYGYEPQIIIEDELDTKGSK